MAQPLLGCKGKNLPSLFPYKNRIPTYLVGKNGDITKNCYF